jgi:hypothetical protein
LNNKEKKDGRKRKDGWKEKGKRLKQSREMGRKASIRERTGKRSK